MLLAKDMSIGKQKFDVKHLKMNKFILDVKSWKWTNLENLFDNWLFIPQILHLRYPPYAPTYPYWSIPTLQLSPPTSCNESVASSLFNQACSIAVNKDDLTKENARIKQVLKENINQESIISKVFKRITNSDSLS